MGGDAGGGARHGPFRETRLDLVLVLPAAGDGRERLVEGPRGTAERAGEPPPVLVVVHGDGNPPVAAVLVGAAEDAVRRRVARAVPQTREDLAVGGVGAFGDRARGDRPDRIDDVGRRAELEDAFLSLVGAE